MTDSIDPKLADLYGKSVNIEVIVNRGKFPHRWIITVQDQVGFFFEQRSFMLRRNAFKFAEETVHGFADSFWR